MINEEKLKKWMEDHVISVCKDGDEWKKIMRRELWDIFDEESVA